MKLKLNAPLIITSIVCLGLGIFIGSQFFSSNKNENDSTVYAVFGNKTVRASDVKSKIENDLLQMEKNIYELKKRAVLDLIREQVPADVVAKQFPPEAEKNQSEGFEVFLKQRNINFKTLKPAAQKDVLKNFEIQKKIEADKAIREQAEKKITWKIPMNYLPDPIEVPKTLLEKSGSGSHQVDVFFNYHCPTCLSFLEKIQTLKSQNNENVSIRYHFFLNESPDSLAYQTVLAALCTNAQDKFLKFHDIISKAPPLEMETLKKRVEETSVDMNKFSDCMKNQKTRELLNSELSSAKKLNVDLNGQVFISGYKISAQETIQNMQTVLDKP